MTFADTTIERAIGRRAARTAILKDGRAYERLYARLQKAMTNSWTDAMREGVAASLDRLRDLEPGAFTKADGQMIMRQLEASVGPEAIRAAMRGSVINLSDALFRAGAAEVGTAAGVSIAFAGPDLDALDILKTGNLYWIGESWNAHTQDLLASALDDYFTEGMTREGLTRRFAEDFATLTERGQRYWELLADHTATKTREMGRVTGYDRAGVTSVQVRAQLDDKTSKICRAMHGRVITVEKMRGQRDTYLDAISRRDGEAAKEAWTMHGEAGAEALKDRPTSRLPGGTGGPPYHFRCRTITVMFFGGAPTGVDAIRQTVTDREQLTGDQRTFVMDLAKGAGFLRSDIARKKFTRHRANIPTAKLADYERDARALINNPKAAMLISTRVPRGKVADGKPGEVTPHAVFSLPTKNRTSGEVGFLATVVDLDENVIVSHHWRHREASANDVAPAIRQVKKGVLQWLIG